MPTGNVPAQVIRALSMNLISVSVVVVGLSGDGYAVGAGVAVPDDRIDLDERALLAVARYIHGAVGAAYPSREGRLRSGREGEGCGSLNAAHRSFFIRVFACWALRGVPIGFVFDVFIVCPRMLWLKVLVCGVGVVLRCGDLPSAPLLLEEIWVFQDSMVWWHDEL